MIKKLFSKKSGFTLVEIVIAFAVFAIMSAMVLQIINTTLYEKQSNAKFMETLKKQEELIVRNGRVGEYDESKKTSDLVLNFGENGTYETGYQMMFPYDEDADLQYESGIAYYVSQNTGDDKNDENYQTPGESFGSSNAGSQSDRLDTRISGTRGFSAINIYNVVNDTSYSGPGVRYFFEVSADGSNMSKDMIPFAQYKMYFYIDGTTTDKDGKVVKTRQDAKILDAGYINEPTLSWTENCKSVSEFTNGSYSSYNKYTVRILNDKCIRIGTPYTGEWKNGEYQRGIQFTKDNHSRFYVVFEKDPKLTRESFGASFASQNNVKNEGDKIVYSPVPILDENGNFTGDNYINIYGAFEKPKNS